MDNLIIIIIIISGRLAQWWRSLPPSPEVPGLIPGLVEGWIFGWPSFPLKFTQLSILRGSVKWAPAHMDRFEAPIDASGPLGVNWLL